MLLVTTVMEALGNVEGECARAGTKVMSLATTAPRQSDEVIEAWWPSPGTIFLQTPMLLLAVVLILA